MKIRRNIALLKLLFSVISEPGHESTCQSPMKYDTRSSRVKNYQLSRPRTESYKNCVIYEGKKRWLDLPPALKRLETIEEFGAEIKTYYTKEFVLTGVVYFLVNENGNHDGYTLLYI